MQVNKLSVSPINKNIVIPNLEGLGGTFQSMIKGPYFQMGRYSFNAEAIRV